MKYVPSTWYSIDATVNFLIIYLEDTNPQSKEGWRLTRDVNDFVLSLNASVNPFLISWWHNITFEIFLSKIPAPCSVGLNDNVIATNSAGIETAIIQDGDYVLYSCPDGYMENGPATVSCSDGRWMISQPFSCIGKLILGTPYKW